MQKKTLTKDFPKVAEQWDYEKNYPLTPSDVTAGSGKKVWWKCKEGNDHKWESDIKNRTSKNNGCPYCSNRKVSETNSLQVKFPDLVSEWDYEKNNPIKPSEIVYGSAKKVWWKCINGHSWKTSIVKRTGDGTNCPKCSNQSSTQEIRILTELKLYYDEVISRHIIEKIEIDIYIPKLQIGIEYDGDYYHKNSYKKDNEKNEKLKDKDIQIIRVREKPLKQISKLDIVVDDKRIKKSDIDELLKIIYENFDQSIPYSQYIAENTFQNDEIYRKYLSYFPNPFPENSLKATNPKLVNEWDYEKNYPLVPENFSKGSDCKIWWKCISNQKHSYKARIYSRANNRGTGCPYCRGLKVDETNSLSNVFPKIAEQWDFEKNYPLTPNEVTVGSGKNVWWKCKEGKDHEWQTTISGRTSNKSKCPFCTNQRVSEDNCLANAKECSQIIKEWDYEKNYPLTPSDVTFGSRKVVWWNCNKGNDHKWENSVSGRTQTKSGCPFCSNQRLSKNQTLENVRPDLLKEWDYNKNEKKPSEIFFRTSKTFNWICKINKNHRWKASLSNRVTKNSGCPYCAKVKIHESDSLQYSHTEHIILKQWDKILNEGITPLEVGKGSTKKIWWKCLKNVDHKWLQSVKDRLNVNYECPYCEKIYVSKEYNLFVTNPEIAEEWNYEKNINQLPNDFKATSNTEVWWKCPVSKDHQWKTTIIKRTKNKHGCPFCANRLPSVTNSLSTKYPNIASLLDIQKNSTTPDKVVASTAKTYWWKCENGIHESWECSPRLLIKQNKSCPKCKEQ